MDNEGGREREREREADLGKGGMKMERKSSRGRREKDVPPLGPGLKLIGPGLEEIIY